MTTASASKTNTSPATRGPEVWVGKAGTAGNAAAFGNRPFQPRPLFEREPGEVVALWTCPVCDAPCHRRHRPGRPRVYCTNACRQRAYRWRCADRYTAGPPSGQYRAPERARTRDRTHALRPHPDFIAGRRDTAGRQITACGSFSKADSDRAHKFWHTEFVTGGPWSCTSCARLLGVPDTPIDVVVERALAHARRARTTRRDVH